MSTADADSSFQCARAQLRQAAQDRRRLIAQGGDPGNPRAFSDAGARVHEAAAELRAHLAGALVSALAPLWERCDGAAWRGYQRVGAGLGVEAGDVRAVQAQIAGRWVRIHSRSLMAQDIETALRTVGGPELRMCFTEITATADPLVRATPYGIELRA